MSKPIIDPLNSELHALVNSDEGTPVEDEQGRLMAAPLCSATGCRQAACQTPAKAQQSPK
jgi:hypothetical protein